MNTKWIMFSAILFLAILNSSGSPLEQTGEWSRTEGYLKARLRLKHRTTSTNNYSEILAYLELCNTCPPEGTVKVILPFSRANSLTFVVKDADGKPIEPKPLFCSTISGVDELNIVLPQDCTMKFCISLNGGGVCSNQALLYLSPGRGWHFDHGTNTEYTLSATLKIDGEKDFSNRHWQGSLELPSVRIPVPIADR